MLKKILIGFGLLFATLIAAGTVFWFGWLSPPDSEEVCTNVEQIVEDDTDALVKKKDVPKELVDTILAKAKKDMRKECERFSTKKPLMMAQAVWVKQLKCMRDAKDMDGLDACEEIQSF